MSNSTGEQPGGTGSGELSGNAVVVRDSAGIVPGAANLPSLKPSPTTLPSLSGENGNFDASDCARVFARCAAIWGGDSTIGDAVRRQALIGEWVDSFGHFTAADVNGAITKLKTEIQWWPKISEVMKHMPVEPGGLPVFNEPQDAPLTEAEVERRGRVVEAIKKAAGFKADYGTNYLEKSDEVREVKPASQEMAVSDELFNTCAARRTRRQQTCETDCARNRSSSNCRFKAERNAPRVNAKEIQPA